VVQFLDEFPHAKFILDQDGDVTETAWVFRGLKDSSYLLEPAIEREAKSKSMEWPIPEIEGKLFQRNIHEQSLFPDMEGIAGLIRQKSRLNWK
jgi:hypothetical protein